MAVKANKCFNDLLLGGCPEADRESFLFYNLESLFFKGVFYLSGKKFNGLFKSF